MIFEKIVIEKLDEGYLLTMEPRQFQEDHYGVIFAPNNTKKYACNSFVDVLRKLNKDIENQDCLHTYYIWCEKE